MATCQVVLGSGGRKGAETSPLHIVSGEPSVRVRMACCRWVNSQSSEAFCVIQRNGYGIKLWWGISRGGCSKWRTDQVARLHDTQTMATSVPGQTAGRGEVGGGGWNPCTGLRFRPKTSSSAQKWSALSAIMPAASGPDTTSVDCDSAERARLRFRSKSNEMQGRVSHGVCPGAPRTVFLARALRSTVVNSA